MTVHRIAALVAGVILLGGCTNTADLKAPIGGFSEATQAAQTTYQEYDRVLSAAKSEAIITIAVSGGGTITTPQDDCGSDAKRCRLTLDVRGHKPVILTTGDNINPVADRIMAGLVTYAQGLEAITDEDTEQGIENRTKATAAGISHLADDVDNLTTGTSLATHVGTEVKDFAGPIASTASFLLSHYLESKKIDALKRETAQMQKILPRLIEVLKITVTRGIAIKRENLSTVYETAHTDYFAHPNSRDKLADLRDAADKLDGALTIDPAAQFDALTQAHLALTKALGGGDLDFQSAMAAITRAITEAQKIQAIVAQYKAATDAK